ncbi:MAG TPA: FHA domain-containing protein, partial [Marmoricola sp.]|nr:FHA domain-containing protein [Marmoricola sp.]
MRISLTIDSAHGSDEVLVDCDDAATVEDLEHALRQKFGCAVPVPGSRRDHIGGALLNGNRLGGRARRRATPSGLRIHVISGPDSGVVCALPEGEHVLGRSGSLSWADPGISRRHLAVRVSGHKVDVCDLESRHGTSLDGQSVGSGTWVAWRPSDILEVGNSVVVLATGSVPTLQSEPTGTGWRRVLRPPRLRPRWERLVVAFPETPRRPERRPLPLVAMLIPLVVGAAIAVLLRRPEYLLFTLVSPVMMAATFASGRWSGSRRYAVAMASYARAYADSEQALNVAIASEEQWLRKDQPDAVEALMTAIVPGRRLWERRREESDFLRVRLGTVDRASSVSLSGSDRQPMDRLVPHSVDLATVGVLGIVGSAHRTDGLLRWLVAQLVVYRAPRDLSLIFLSCDADESWGWLRWLPHLVPRHGEACAVLVGNDVESVTARVTELGVMIRSRRAAQKDRQDLLGLPAVVVVIRNYREASAIADLTALVRDGPGVGVYVVSSADVDLELSEHTQAVVVMRDARGSMIGNDGEQQENILIEQVSQRWIDRCARGLAAYCDVALDDAQIPAVVRLADLLDPDQPDELQAHWSVAGPGAVAVLGAEAEGPVSIDLAV